jgi:hypothetical protein
MGIQILVQLLLLGAFVVFHDQVVKQIDEEIPADQRNKLETSDHVKVAQYGFLILLGLEAFSIYASRAHELKLKDRYWDNIEAREDAEYEAMQEERKLEENAGNRYRERNAHIYEKYGIRRGEEGRRGRM